MNIVQIALLALLSSLAFCSIAIKSYRARAITSIIITADGSVEPATAPISIINNSIYVLEADIEGSVMIQKSNVTFDGNGYTLSGVGSGYGLYLSGRINVTVYNVKIRNFYYGITMADSSFNVIYGNDITHNTQYGVLISASSNNTFYHNNFISNTQHIYMDTLCCNSTNLWDDGFEGNFWSNYTDSDLNKDGIGDNPHEPVFENYDRFPLAGTYHEHKISAEHSVSTISNSTIHSLEYVKANTTLRLSISSSVPNQQHGFIRMRIPHELVMDPYTVTLTEGNPSYWNYSIRDDGENRWIYFTYSSQEGELIIISEHIPLELVLAALATTATLILARLDRSKQPLLT